MLLENERINELLQELTYLELPVKLRFHKLKQLKELMKQQNTQQHPNLFQANAQYVAERVHDYAIDPPMVNEILVALEKNVEDCPQVIAQLVLLLCKSL